VFSELCTTCLCETVLSGFCASLLYMPFHFSFFLGCVKGFVHMISCQLLFWAHAFDAFLL
jgi:hypothetical protein